MDQLAPLLRGLGTLPQADIRWISATGIVLRFPGAPEWSVVVEGAEDAPDTVRALVARWASDGPVEVLYVGGSPALREADTPTVRVLQLADRGELWSSEPAGPLHGFLGSMPKPRAAAPEPPPSAPVRRTWLDSTTPAMTQILVVLNVLIYLLQIWWEGQVGPIANAQLGALIPGEAVVREPWRLLSYALLHGSPTHLLMNSWALWVTGMLVEQFIGRGRMLLIYVAGALGGGVAVALGSNAMVVGASGAVWGLMTATFVLVYRARGMPQRMRASLMSGLGQNLVINLILSFLPGISFLGHLGGGLAGALIVATGLPLVGLNRNGTPPWFRWVMLLSGTALVASGVIAIGLALLRA